jgi:cytochrome c biogenesis protein ResB
METQNFESDEEVNKDKEEGKKEKHVTVNFPLHVFRPGIHNLLHICHVT